MKDRVGVDLPLHLMIFKVAEIAESKIQDARINYFATDRLNRICLKTVSTCMTEHPDIFKNAAHENYINIPRLEKRLNKFVLFPNK